MIKKQKKKKQKKVNSTLKLGNNNVIEEITIYLYSKVIIKW